ncbi:MAG: BON domain-containing protein [Myxococcota bacterium]
MQVETVRFDESTRSSLSDQPVGPGGVTTALRQAAEAAGLDAPSELYNEALRAAADGRHRDAMERLQILICLDGDDGEAHLMMAKVRVACQEWGPALDSLDKARANGATVPMTLRSAIESHLQAERAHHDETTSNMDARHSGEVQALRQEARRLRSDNARLLGRVHDLGQEVRRWAYGTTGFAIVASVFMVGNIIYAGSSLMSPSVDGPVPTVVQPAAGTPVVDGAPVTIPAAGAPTQPDAPIAPPPPASALAGRAAQALQAAPGLDGTQLQVAVADGKAVVTGTVATFRQRKRAEDVLTAIPGISEVDANKVKVTARTKGAKHTVVSGDSLSTISYGYYGDSTRAKQIIKANPKTLKGKANLQIGMKLVLPPIE